MMLSLLALATCLNQSILAEAFTPSTTTTYGNIALASQRTQQSSSTTTALYGSKRRGRLANNVSLNDEGKVSKVMTNKEKQKLGNSKMKRSSSSSASKKTKGENGAAVISPLLAEWASASGDDDNDGAVTAAVASTATSTVAAASANVFVPFNDDDDDDYDYEEGTTSFTTSSKKNRKKSDKQAKKSARETLNAMQSAQIEANLDSIEEMLQTTNCNVNELLSYIQNLVDVGASSSNNNNQILMPNLKSLVSARQPTSGSSNRRADNNSEGWKQPSYRLAWVGSDNAICHIGTSLHKVPLARLQEIYLLLGYNRWELLEVIRILGPFPNVRNTLRGDVRLEKKRLGGNKEGVRLTIAYNSMVDGTGKEILAGKEDNIKYVKLDIWFANEKAIVCTVPKEDADGNEIISEENPLMSGNGENVLLFVAEDNLEEQLEKLRAA